MGKDLMMSSEMLGFGLNSVFNESYVLAKPQQANCTLGDGKSRHNVVCVCVLLVGLDFAA